MYSLSSTAGDNTIIAPKIDADRPGATSPRIGNDGATAGEERNVRIPPF